MGKQILTYLNLIFKYIYEYNDDVLNSSLDLNES